MRGGQLNVCAETSFPLRVQISTIKGSLLGDFFQWLGGTRASDPPVACGDTGFRAVQQSRKWYEKGMICYVASN